MVSGYPTPLGDNLFFHHRDVCCRSAKCDHADQCKQAQKFAKGCGSFGVLGLKRRPISQSLAVLMRGM